MQTSPQNRIAGSLYGLLVADAFGCPVEGWAPSRIEEVYGRLTEMEEATGRWRPRGLHSDDGQQALALAAALLENPDEPEVALARLLVEMYEAGPGGSGCFGSHRGTGRNFRATVQLLAAGGSPHCGAQPSSGNGVAMMIAPVAWFWHDDPTKLLETTVAVARVKQKDIRGIASAGAMAAVIARALTADTPADIDPGAVLEMVMACEDLAARVLGSEAHLRTMSSAMAAMIGVLDRPRSEVLRHITGIANSTADRQCWPGSGYAPASVVTSIYMTLTSTSFEQAVVDTVDLGGDTDTTGAMVGAMAGALYGFEAIPTRWYERLVAREAFDAWIGPIVERRRGWMPSPSLVELEHGWTKLLSDGAAKRRRRRR